MHISFFTVFADTERFRLQRTHNTEDDQSFSIPISRTANVKCEDFHCFLENECASAYKYGEEFFLNKFTYGRASEKSHKSRQRLYEHVKQTEPNRSTIDMKKRYLNGSRAINCKTYFCFHKGDHVRKKEKKIIIIPHYTRENFSRHVFTR